MSEIFNTILVSLSRLLFSSPAFVKMAETSLSESRQVLPDNSSGEVLFCATSPSGSSLLDILEGPTLSDDSAYCESPRLLEAATTRLSTHDNERLPRLEDLGQSGTFFSAPSSSSPTLGSKSATGSSIVSEPHYPPSDSDEALNSFSLSLISDNSVDDDGFNLSGSLDTLLSPPSSSVTLQTPSKLLLPPRVAGLGISGLMRKDGSGPFDGLGIVSIESSNWRHEIRREHGIDLSDSIQKFRRRPASFSSSSSTYDGSSESEDFDKLFLDSGDKISDVFLQETLLTFTEDPFHQLCHSSVRSSSSIPDCGNSWSELALDESTSTPISEFKKVEDSSRVKSHSTNNSRPMILNSRRRTPKLNTNFSSPTISSELKRSSTIITTKKTLRNRSSSWPSSAREETAAAALLPRCRWRL